MERDGPTTDADKKWEVQSVSEMEEIWALSLPRAELSWVTGPVTLNTTS